MGENVDRNGSQEAIGWFAVVHVNEYRMKGALDWRVVFLMSGVTHDFLYC